MIASSSLEDRGSMKIQCCTKTEQHMSPATLRSDKNIDDSTASPRCVKYDTSKRA